MILRMFSIAVLTILMAAGVTAQNEPSEWSHSLGDTTVSVGDEIEIIFRAVIPDTYLVYSNDYDCPGGGPLPAEFKYDSSAAYTLVGTATPVGAEKVYDDIFECEISEFHTTAEFRQKIKILSADAKISGVLWYQMCAATGLCVLHKYPYTIENLTINQVKN